MNKNNKGPDKSCNTYTVIIPLFLFTSPLPSHTLCEAPNMRQHILLHLSLLNPEFPKLLCGKASPQAYVLLYRTFWATLLPCHKPLCCSCLSMPQAQERQLASRRPCPNADQWLPAEAALWAPAGPTRRAHVGTCSQHSHPEHDPRRDASPQDEHRRIFFEFVKNLKYKTKRNTFKK